MKINNYNRKGMALILVLSMLMTLFAGISVTVGAVNKVATEVYYCGQKLDATNKYLLATSNTGSAPVPLASATESADGYILLAEFDAAKGTLTYKHGYNSELSWNTQVSIAKLEDGIFYGIKANGDLTIELGDYNNFLYLAWRDPSGTTMRAIDVDGNLTINGGSGILKMTATPALDTDGTTEYTSYGIKASGDVNLNGGTIHFYEAHYTDSQTSLKANSKVVYVDAGGDINVKGATVKMRAQKGTPNNAIVHFGKEPIVANGYTESDDSTIDIGGSTKSLGTEGTTTGNLNNLSLTPPEEEIGGGETGGDGDDSTDDDEANLPTPEARPNATEVYYCGVKLDATNKYLMVENTEKGERIPYASSTDTVNGYTLLAEFDAKTATLTYKSGFDSALGWDTQMFMTQLEENGKYYGIKANGNLTIDIGKYNIFLYVDWRTPSGVEMRAIDVDGKLTINGTRGTLKMTASPALDTDGTTSYTSYGIRAYGDVKLNGGTIHLYEAHYTDGQTSLKANSKVVYISAGGGNIYVDGATVKMRAQKSTPNNAIVHFGKEPIVAEGYIESDDSTIDIGGSAKSLGTEGETTDNKNNLSLTAPEKEYDDENIVDGPATELFYCGAKLDEKNPYLLINSSTRAVMASSKKAATGHELYAIFENGKLIYQRGFSEELSWNTQVDMVQCEEDDIYRGIKSNGDLIIDVGSYHNFLYLNWRFPKGTPLYAIDVPGDLSIIGTTGTLKMCATPALNTASGSTFTSYGIKAKGDVRLNGGKIFIYEGHYTPDAVNAGSTTTYVSAGGNIYVDGADIKMMARKSTPGITHFNKEPIISEGYTKSAYENFEIGRDNSAESDTSSVGGEVPTTGNKNNLVLTAPEKLKLIVGGAYIYKDKPYLVKDGDGWKESDAETDAYAVYDEEKQTLTFTKNAEIKASMDTLLGEDGKNLHAFSSILANFDLEVVIPEGVKVTLNADNTTGIERALWVSGDVKVSGGGTLDAYAGPSKSEGNYMSAAICAAGKVSIDKITATLHTVKAETDGKSGHVIYGKDGIEISGYATVYAGTDLGKLCNVAPVIYAEADAMMAAESTGDYNAPVAKSELLPYDASRVTGMKYLQVAPKKMLPESVGGYGENGKLSLLNPVVEYVFNYEIASGAVKENIAVSGGAAVESVEADGRVLKVTLKDVSVGGKYTIEISGIANSMGVVYSGKNTIEVSNINIESVKLNGSENGSVINGANTASVTITTQSEKNVMVVATVWGQGTYGKKLRMAKSVAESVSGTQTITIEGLSAESGDTIEVMVWNGAATRNVLRKSVKFGG